MASVQERLQLKRLPLDNWTVSEKLCLASAVAKSGDQNWMGVSRSLKMMCGTNRPNDWFSQKSCAAQYGKLLENVETPKRKKRNEKDTSQSTVETPSELILRKLTQERIAELKKCIQEEREEYAKIKEEITAIENDLVDEQTLREWWTQIENEDKRLEKEQQKHAQWLKEREERMREMERSWRPGALHFQQGSPAQSPSKLQLKGKIEEMDVDDPNSRQGTSPLLTSLLKSPSPAPNPTTQSIMHNVMNVSNTQTRVAAPTITNLLTGSTTILPQPAMVKQIVGSVTTSVATPFVAQLQAQPCTGPAPNDHLINNVPQSPSQSAPTLSMLLENKSKESISKAQPLMRIEPSAVRVNDAKPTTSGEHEITAIDSPIKDEDQQLMEDINGLIPDNIDELANILNENNADILNPELLEEESILENVDAFIDVAENASDAVELDAADEPIRGESKDVEMVDVNEEKFQESLGTVVKSEAAVADDTEKPTEEQNTVDVEVAEVKNEESVDVKQDENSSHSTLTELEKVASISKDVHDESSSDLSNDTPLSELIKQESTAKAELQQKTAAAAAAAVAASEDAAKIEKEEPETFESDSNDDDKCLGSIKREIQSLAEQKEHESSENSSEAPVEVTPPVEVNEEEPEVEKSEVVVEAEPPVEVDEEEPQPIEVDKKEEEQEEEEEQVEEIEDEVETIEPVSLKPEDDEIVELSSNEADQVQEKDVEEEEHRATPLTTVDVDDEIEDVQPTVEEEEEKHISNEPTAPERSDTDVPTNFANIFSKEDSDDVVVEEPVEATETVEPEEKKETIEEERRVTPTLTTDADEIIENKGSVESVEIVEIKDDDEKSESQIIVIEEADDLIIEESVGTMDSEKNDEIVAHEEPLPKEEETIAEEAAPKSEPERKSSTDDELFEDAKENIDDVKSEDLQSAETEAAQQPITIIDTDDDMPMEVIKEDKVGRAKRDYSRRNKESTQSIDKRSEETTSSDDVFSTIGSRLRLKERDRSESPYVEEDSGEPATKTKRRYSSTPNIDSLPNSPASSDDREYRSWKKSILLVYNGLIAHRCASLFTKPITEDQAPNYKTIVYQPMDLHTLKRNIDSGNIRTTIEFQRYVMLMCHNAMFYNFNDTIICVRAKEMLNDALTAIDEFSDTWKKENEKTAATASTSTGSTTKVVRGRKSNRLMN